MTQEERIKQLEQKVAALETALQLALAAAKPAAVFQPTKDWLDTTMEKIDGAPRLYPQSRGGWVPPRRSESWVPPTL